MRSFLRSILPLALPVLALGSDIDVVHGQAVGGRSNARLAYLGINMSGAEIPTADMARWHGREVYPDAHVIDYFTRLGMNIVRLPINWQRMQPTPCGAFDPAAVARLDAAVARARTRGLVVIVGLHEFGYAYGELIGRQGKGIRCFADFWSRMAAHLRGDPGIWLGLMNEPHEQKAAEWLPAINAALAAVRQAGSRQRVLVSSTYWDDVEKWVGTDNETDMAGRIVDPANNWVLEFHYYFNPWTGPDQHARDEYQGVRAFGPATRWARAHKVQLFLGEIGISPDPVSLAALDRTIDFLETNRDTWLGMTYWTYGDNGGAPFGISSNRADPQPQLRLLMRHLPPTATLAPPTRRAG